MSSMLPVSTILGAAPPAESRLLANVSYPLHGLLLVVAALLLVALAMVLIRKAVRRFKVTEDHTGPLLVPASAGRLPPEIVAVITAAVDEILGPGGNIVAINSVGPETSGAELAWSREGRREHFASHKVR